MNTTAIPRLLGCLLLGAASLLAADTPAEAAARTLHRSLGDAVVFVRATVSVTVTPGDQPAQSRDRTFEQLGTVVSADGRVLLAASSIDPAGVMDGRTVNTPMGEMKISATSQVKEAFIVLADGTEIPAKVVLKDKDLNLALVAPIDAPAEKLVAVDTGAAASATVEPVDNVVILGRMDKSFNRAAKVEVDAVAAVITKPRTLISIHVSAPGCPVFNAAGKFVGLTSAKVDSAAESESGGMSMEPVVIPAEAIRKFLAEAKPAAK